MGKDLTEARSSQRKLMPDMSGWMNMSKPPCGEQPTKRRCPLCAEVSATEEPDAGVLHVRVCAGGAG